MSLSEMSRRERKKEETRRRIFEVAVELFRSKGFEETTVDEITEKADVARGTFFNYFPRKESVLAWLSESRLIDEEERSAEILASPRPAREKLVDLFLNAASAYEEDRDLSRFVFAEWMKRGFAPTHEAGLRWQKLIVALIDEGRASGQLRADVTGTRADSLLSGVYIATIYEWLYCPAECEAAIANLRDELAARLDLVFDGLSARQEVRA